MRLHFVAKETSLWPIQITRWIYDSPIPATIISYPHPAMLPELAEDDFIVVDESLLRSLTGVIEDRHNSTKKRVSDRHVIVIGSLKAAPFICLSEPLVQKDLLAAVEQGHDTVTKSVDQRTIQWSEGVETGPKTIPTLDPVRHDWLAEGWPKDLEIGEQLIDGAKGGFSTDGHIEDYTSPSEQAFPNDHAADNLTHALGLVDPTSPPAKQAGGNSKGEVGDLATAQKRWRGRFKKSGSVELQTSPQTTTPRDADIAGHIISVVGPGGVGTSTTTMAIAQSLGQTMGPPLVLDARSRGELAFLNDARAHAMGVSELIRAARISHIAKEDLATYLEWISSRHYYLLKSNRSRRDWLGWDQDSLNSAFGALRNSFKHVVVDIGNDFEGSSESGSMDIESKNLLGRTALAFSSLVVLVGSDNTKGIYSLAAINREVSRSGLTKAPSVFVINRCASSRLRQAMAKQELSQLLSAPTLPMARTSGGDRPEVIYIPARNIDPIISDVLPLPSWMVEPFNEYFFHHALQHLEVPMAEPRRLGKAAES